MRGLSGWPAGRVPARDGEACSRVLTEHPHLDRRGEKPVNPAGLVRGLFRGAGGRNVTRYTPLLLLGRSRVCAGNGQGRISAAPRGELLAAARFAVQLGRAACRERVCHYV